MTIIRIGIVDDHAILRTALRRYFSEQDDMCVAGEAATGKEAIDLVRTTAIDVLIMDISMPDRSGLDVLTTIRAKAPDVGILVFTMHPEEHYALPVIRQGASGFLNKECDPPQILEAVRAVAQGHCYLSPTAGELLAQALDKNVDAPHEQLSEREFQVFLKLAAGASSNEVAQSLCLRPKTISCYRTRVMHKLGLHSNVDLTYYAVKNHLIQ